jgi:hypothetical protein
MFLILLAVAAFLVVPSMVASPAVVEIQAATETNTIFTGRNNFFERFVYNRGIFILKDESANHAPGDVFFGSVNITQASGFRETGSGRDYTNFSFRTVKEVNGRWEDCNWFSFDALPNRMGGSYRFPKNLPAGKYGIEATAMEGGSLSNNFANARPAEQAWPSGDVVRRGINGGRIVDGVYVIMYGTELNHIYCTHAGSSILNMRQYTSATVDIDVNINQGATNILEVNQERVGVSGRVGNLNDRAAIDLNSLRILVTDHRGQEVSAVMLPWRVVDGNRLRVTLPTNMPATRYHIRVQSPIDNSIYGTFVIDNTRGAVWLEEGGSSGVVFLVLGFLVLAVGVALFVVPKIQMVMNKDNYARVERKLLRDNRKANVSQSSVSVAAPKSDFHPMYQMTEDEKAAAKAATQEFKEAEKAAKAAIEGDEIVVESKRPSGLLSKLQESRMKRDIAREAGLTMEEFRELEKQQKDIVSAKEDSLGEFRRAIDNRGSVISEENVEQVMNKHVDGETQFDLLDSVKASVGVGPELTAEQYLAELRKQQGIEESSAPSYEGNQQSTPIGNIFDAAREQLAEEAAAQQTSEYTAPEPQQEPPRTGSLLDRLKKFTGEDS